MHLVVVVPQAQSSLARHLSQWRVEVGEEARSLLLVAMAACLVARVSLVLAPSAKVGAVAPK